MNIIEHCNINATLSCRLEDNDYNMLMKLVTVNNKDYVHKVQLTECMNNIYSVNYMSQGLPHRYVS